MGFSVATTVVTPAANFTLTTLANAKDELNIPTVDTSKDAWVTRAIGQISRAIASHCKRVFAVETVLDTFDIDQDAYPWQTPGGFAQLQLTRWPVVSVASVVVAPASASPLTLTADTDYRLDSGSGLLLRLSRWTGAGITWEAQPIAVQYTAGYAVVPDDLEMIALRLITERYAARGRDPTLIQQETPGIGLQRWWFGGAPGQTGQFAPDIEAALDEYCERIVR